jgi:ribonuclease HII
VKPKGQNIEARAKPLSSEYPIHAEMFCGIDEAGRGPVLGPLVICGVAVDDDDPLRKMGVKDSKKLTPKKREELAPLILGAARVEIVEIPAEEIDAVRAVITLNELEARVFASIIERLQPEHAYLDAADANEKEFGRMVQAQLTRKVKITSEHKADDTYPVVSAASIIAKVTRDRRVRDIEKEIGRPIGSGYTSDPKTISFLNDWMTEKKTLPPHCRRSWDTSQNIMNLKSLRRLDQFE